MFKLKSVFEITNSIENWMIIFGIVCTMDALKYYNGFDLLKEYIYIYDLISKIIKMLLFLL